MPYVLVRSHESTLTRGGVPKTSVIADCKARLTPDTTDVLLIPRRVVPRLADLHPEEVSDLFLSVQRVGRVLEKAYDAEALTVSLQVGSLTFCPVHLRGT